MFAKVPKILWVLPLALLFFVVWNVPVLLSVSRPLTTAALSHVASVSGPSYVSSEWKFYYPRLGIEAPVTESADSSPMDTADWAQMSKALTQGVSLNYVGPSVDTAPLAYITGHSSDTYPHPYSAVFAGLGQAKTGDLFILTGGGAIRTYKVISIQLVNPHNTEGFSKTQLTGNGSGSYVALVTCWPLLTTTNRKVIVGEYLGDQSKISYSTK